MPRDANGLYTLPLPEVVSGEVITSLWGNTTTLDLANSMTNSLSRSGQGAMLAALRVVDGTAPSAAVGFATEVGTGLYRPEPQVLGLTVFGVERARLKATGNMSVAAALPLVDGDLTRKDYVDTGITSRAVLLTTDQTAAGIKTFSSNPLSSAAQSVEASALTRKDYLDGLDVQNVKLSGAQTIGGTKTFSNNIVLSSAAPTGVSQATRKDYVDNADNLRPLKAGDTMTGQLNGITPTANANFTRKDYVDQAIADAIAAIPPQTTDFPIGSVLSGFNPNGIFPGTWTQWQANVFPMSAAANGATGGSNDAVVVSHNHGVTDPSHSHTLNAATDLSGGGNRGGRTNSANAGTISAINSSSTGISVNSEGVSGTNANRPAFRSTQMWERTA